MTIISDKQVMILLDPDRDLQRLTLPKPLAARLDDIRRRASIMQNEEIGSPPPANAVTVEELQVLLKDIDRAHLSAAARAVIGGVIEKLDIRLSGRAGGRA